MQPKKLLGAAVAAFVVAACHASVSAGVGDTTTTSAAVDPGAIEQVTLEATQARCARADSCGEIGPNARWADRGACMDAVRRNVRDQLIGRACKNGFQPVSMDDCLHAMRDARCEDPRGLHETCDATLACR